MLPTELHGPGKTIKFCDPSEFVKRAKAVWPHLPKDFVLQVCFEHPDRFNDYFPSFNPEKHVVVTRSFCVEWIKANVRYDDDRPIEHFWSEQFEALLRNLQPYQNEIFDYMLQNKTWFFPPVIVKSDFAIDVLDSPMNLGKPYHLFEGTHRVSYLLTMETKGMIANQSIHNVLEITMI